MGNAIMAAPNAGIILVAAVGDNSSLNVLYPEKYPEVIAVTALKSGDRLYEIHAFIACY